MLKGYALEQHILAHCKRISRSKVTRGGFCLVEKPMHVFKRIMSGKDYHKAIVNMIIPVGETIFVYDEAYKEISSFSRDNRKMRATKAYVHSIVRKHDHKQLTCGYSDYMSWNSKVFRYRVGRNVKPRLPFSMKWEQCASGIHFFVNLDDALAY